MSNQDRHTPLVLMILDGWGHRQDAPDNAISQADTPCWDDLWANATRCLLETSGESVGLPAGQMGNSEVGHMNIGAGRIVCQEFSRISQAIERVGIWWPGGCWGRREPGSGRPGGLRSPCKGDVGLFERSITHRQHGVALS